MSVEEKLRVIQVAKRRHKVAYKYALVFGLSPDVSGVLLEQYMNRLTGLLTNCDKCVRNWHMGRKAYLKDLAEYVVTYFTSTFAKLFQDVRR
jgi:senataxin